MHFCLHFCVHFFFVIGLLRALLCALFFVIGLLCALLLALFLCNWTFARTFCCSLTFACTFAWTLFLVLHFCLDCFLLLAHLLGHVFWGLDNSMFAWAFFKHFQAMFTASCLRGHFGSYRPCDEYSICNSYDVCIVLCRFTKPYSRSPRWFSCQICLEESENTFAIPCKFSCVHPSVQMVLIHLSLKICCGSNTHVALPMHTPGDYIRKWFVPHKLPFRLNAQASVSLLH